MSTTSGIAPQRGLDRLAGERIIYGAVHLDVLELERALTFWRDLIGLRELPSAADETRLGVDDRALVVLHPGAVRGVTRGHTGLYHLAIHLPDEVEFARVVVRLAQARVPQSPTDHIFSKATYLQDPDGVMLELTLETPERYRSIEIGTGTVSLIDSDGRRRGGTEPLDLEAALAPLAGGAVDLPLASGSYVGHVHLHVADLEGAHSFYRDTIGFEEHAFMRPIGMADLGAGGRFPHRLAINNWHGTAARPAQPGTAGLRHFELTLRGDERLEQLAGRAALTGLEASPADDGSLTLHDPAGNRIVLVGAPA